MRTTLVLLLLCAAGCPAKEKATTQDGTRVLDWNRGPTTFDTGVSLGQDMGTPISEERLLTFTPKDPRDGGLGPVRLDVKILRGDIGIVANAQGDRPADKGTTPKHVEVTLVENHGWTVTGKCDPKLSGPAVGEGRGAVTFTQTCQVKLASGDDAGTVALTLHGDGKHQFMASFGTVTTTP